MLTINSLLADLPQFDTHVRPGAEALQAVLSARAVRMVTCADRKKIDAAEIRRSEALGKLGRSAPGYKK
jgi:hypothetical protein